MSIAQSLTTPPWRHLFGHQFQNTRILITGGAGFIGSHLVEALCTLGASVVVLDDLSNGTTDNLRECPSIEFVKASILDGLALKKAVHGCRYVFHQAALGSVPRSVEEPLLYQQVNIAGTLKVLEAARRAGVRRLMFAAGSSAYGDHPVAWNESMPPRPKSPHAATKVAGVALVRSYSSSQARWKCAPRREFS